MFITDQLVECSHFADILGYKYIFLQSAFALSHLNH